MSSTPTDDARRASSSSTTEFQGRTALVTGAGSGIGRAIALELARGGARVLVLGRRKEPLDETVAAIEAIGGEASSVRADLAAADTPAHLAERYPEIDLLVHNAAAFATFAFFEDVPSEEFDVVFETIVLGPMRITAALLPRMKARGFGRVLFIGSIAGRLGAHGQAAYSSAKSALGGLTRSLALEGASHGVTCNMLEPGIVDTARVHAALPPGQVQRLEHATPVGRIGTVEEIARIARHLLSPSTAFVTGMTYPAAGGLGLGLTRRPDPPIDR